MTREKICNNVCGLACAHCSHPCRGKFNARIVSAEGQTMSLAGATRLVAGGTERWQEDGQVKFTNDVRWGTRCVSKPCLFCLLSVSSLSSIAVYPPFLIGSECYAWTYSLHVFLSVLVYVPPHYPKLRRISFVQRTYRISSLLAASRRYHTDQHYIETSQTYGFPLHH